MMRLLLLGAAGVAAYFYLTQPGINISSGGGGGGGNFGNYSATGGNVGGSVAGAAGGILD